MAGEQTELTDEELVLRYRNGHTDALDLLMERYKVVVRRISRARFLIGGDEEDLIQEGMIGLYRAVQDYQAERGASFHTFAELCINRQMIKAIESSNSQKHFPLNHFVPLTAEEWDLAMREAGDSPEALILEQEAMNEYLEDIEKRLSPLERKVLHLYLGGLDYRQIAQQLSKSPKSIDNALQRIRKKVRSEQNGSA